MGGVVAPSIVVSDGKSNTEEADDLLAAIQPLQIVNPITSRYSTVTNSQSNVPRANRGAFIENPPEQTCTGLCARAPRVIKL